MQVVWQGSKFGGWNPKSRPKTNPAFIISFIDILSFQVSDIPQQQQQLVSNNAQLPIFQTNFQINANQLSQNGISFIAAPNQICASQQQLSQSQSVPLRGARAILPKPSSGQNLSSVQQIASAVQTTSVNGSQQQAQMSQVFPQVNSNNMPINLNGQMILNGQQFTMGNQQFVARMPSTVPSAQKTDTSTSDASAAAPQFSNPVNPMVIRNPTNVVYTQTIQTPNGPMMVAFLPNSLNSMGIPGKISSSSAIAYNVFLVIQSTHFFI